MVGPVVVGLDEGPGLWGEALFHRVLLDVMDGALDVGRGA